MIGSARARCAALALLSAAVILLQILVTRLLSVVVWYHWAFFSISLSMLGLGVPGVWFALRGRAARRPSAWLLASAIAVPAGIVAIVKASSFFGPNAVLFCLACLLPAVLCLGAAVCLLLLDGDEATLGRRYACDLLGACLGALAVIPLMTVVPTPALAAGVGALPLLAYGLLGGSRRAAVLLGAGLATLLAWGEPLRLRHAKLYEETGNATPIYERWTPTARLTVFDGIFFLPGGQAGFGWGLGSVPARQTQARQYWLEQDGSAGTPITEFDGDLSRLEYLLSDVTTVGHQVRPPGSVAVVGAGGGRDILSALVSGARTVDAIELNAGIVQALRGPFAAFSGGVYDLPGVRAVVGEGRSVLTRTERRYDLIQISLIDSWAATAAGAFALSENNLYTREAYRLYWSRLTPRGMVATSRWMAGGFGLEMPRLLLLVRSALEAEGVARPGAHIVLVQGGMVGTLLMSKAPFGAADLAALREVADRRGFVVHLPGGDLPVSRRLQRAFEEGPDLFRPAGLVMDPPTDDRPFFFQVISPLRPIPPESLPAGGPNAQGVTALQRLVWVMTALTLLLFFAPFPLARWLRPVGEFWRASLYFGAIGLAFMFVEVAWLQRFILFLGHPSLATTVALGSVLLGAGLGSLAAARVGLAWAQRLGWLLPAAITLCNLALAPLFGATLGWPWAWRVLLATAMLAPVGWLMGLGFPLGMARFLGPDRPWLWALNGAASVLASVASLALSMEIGFTRVAEAGAIAYLAAWLLLRRGRVSS